tara:strand:- start:5973 stop:6209 length:237 start_codon:yes stop_codon:yes gene_type:complete
MNKNIAIFLLSFIGIVVVVDTALSQFFNVGSEQKNVTIIYCIAFILLSIKFPDILKRKYVTVPIYAMILQTIYSLFLV